MFELDASVIEQILELFPKCLNIRSKQIVEMRYGLNGNSKNTLQQIGDMFGVCRERIRQIEKKAIRKLKHPSRLNKILETQCQR